MALQQPAEAAASSRRALALAREQGAGESELERIHYQLGLALRKAGAREEAAAHLGEARRIAARWTEAPPEARALDASAAPASLAERSPLSRLPAAQRLDLRRRVLSALAQAYLNLGVMRVQAGRPGEAVALLEEAAGIDGESPRIQYSLGIARFSAGQFDKATAPLLRALAASPGDASLKRMLAMAWLNTEAYARAAELLKDDPERERDASLQLAYGLALAGAGQEAEAEAIFLRLLAEHGESAELKEALRQLKARR
jgi:tetratricopeptide (TPR) repeat protein